MVNLAEIKSIVPECCDLDAYDISLCNQEEQMVLREFLPGAKSIIIFGHHIESSIEWMWFPSKAERGNCTCAADLHLKAVVEKVAEYLCSREKNCTILPYPDPYGVLFKNLASRSVMGELGDSHLFLHKQWGPWIHLRVMLTEAEIKNDSVARAAGGKEQVCLHCNKCIESCPGLSLEMREMPAGLSCGRGTGRD
jgi:epoxyqueuosine reductase QueG